MVFLCCAGSQAQNIFSKKPLKMAGGCELLIADSVATVTIDKDGDNSGAFATRLSVDTDGADNGGSTMLITCVKQPVSVCGTAYTYAKKPYLKSISALSDKCNLGPVSAKINGNGWSGFLIVSGVKKKNEDASAMACIGNAENTLTIDISGIGTRGNFSLDDEEKFIQSITFKSFSE